MISAKFIRYVLVGHINLLVCISTMALVAKVYNVYSVYTTCGYLAAFLMSFFLNLKFTFRVAGFVSKRLQYFLLINLGNLGFVQGLQWLFIEYFLFPVIPTIGVCMVIYTIVGYFMNQHFVFNFKQQAYESARLA